MIDYQRRTILYLLNVYGDIYIVLGNSNIDLLLEKVDIIKAIENLPKIEKEIILNRFVYGYTTRETAALIGRNIGYVSETAQSAVPRLLSTAERRDVRCAVRVINIRKLCVKFSIAPDFQPAPLPSPLLKNPNSILLSFYKVTALSNSAVVKFLTAVF